MKPAVYILQHGSLNKISNPVLPGAFGVHVTTGLIVYEQNGEKKGMVIDPGMVVDFINHQNKIRQLGLDQQNDITHILCTHFHQDHIQSLALYPEKTQVFHYGSSSILGSEEYGARIYTQGFIEIPEIKYIKIDNAHTKKDTIYVVDSENEGKVSFVGDLIFSTLDNMPLEKQHILDRDASTDPTRRYEEFKKFFDSHRDITDFYLGHADRKVGRDEVDEYFGKFKIEI